MCLKKLENNFLIFYRIVNKLTFYGNSPTELGDLLLIILGEQTDQVVTELMNAH